MKILLVGFTCLVLAACGQQSSPVTPTGTAAPSADGLASHKGSNHFDPPPIKGYDTAKWHDLSFNSPKYVLGRALVDLPPTGENLKRVAESQGLQYLGKDLVAFPDGTVVDFISDFEGVKPRWQYQLSH
jgi:hypothetical protein